MLAWFYQCCCLFSCCRRIGQECRGVNLIASYGYLYHVLDRAFWLMNFSYIGYLGKGNLAAAVLGVSIVNLSFIFLEGFLHYQDVMLFVSTRQSKHANIRKWLYMSVLITIIFIILASTLLFIFSFVLYASIGVKTSISLRAVVFSWFLLPSLFLHGLFLIVHKYMKFQNVLVPSLLSLVVGIVANVIGNTIFMYTLGLGIVGCSFGIALGKGAMILVLAYFYRKENEYTTLLTEGQEFLLKAWRKVKKLLPFRRAHFTYRKGKRKGGQPRPSSIAADGSEVEMRRIGRGQEEAGDDSKVIEEEEEEAADNEDEDVQNIPLLLDSAEPTASPPAPSRSRSAQDLAKSLAVGLPSALLLSLYRYPIELSTLVVIQLGSIALCSHYLVLFLMQSIVYAFIHPLAVGAGNRVYALLLSRRLTDLRYTLFTSFLQCLVLSVSFAGLIYGLKDYIGWIFTVNEDVVRRLSRIVWLGSLYLIASSLLIYSMNILKIVGYQLDVVIILTVGVWGVGSALGAYLAFYASLTYDLEGIWIGGIAGTSLSALCFCLYVLSLDWGYEVKKFVVLSAEGSRGRSYYDTVLTAPDSAGIGGLVLRTYRNIEEEMEEMERIEDIEVELNEPIV